MNPNNSCSLSCGHGSCIDHACVCNKDYIYDRVRHLYDNCYLSVRVQHGFVGSTIAISALLIIFAIFVTYGKKSHARLLGQVTALEGLFVLLATLTYYTQGTASYATWVICAFFYAPFF